MGEDWLDPSRILKGDYEIYFEDSYMGKRSDSLEKELNNIQEIIMNSIRLPKYLCYGLKGLLQQEPTLENLKKINCILHD